jgi:hypothetical protein
MGLELARGVDFMPDLLRLARIFLLVVGVSSAGHPSDPMVPSSGLVAHDVAPQMTVPEAPQNQDSSVSTVSAFPTYSNSPDGLEALIEEMITLEKRGDTTGLAPYLQSLVLPNPETWFRSKFGDNNCGGEHLAANDCLGTRLALRYAITARNLPAAAALTLSDLVDEHLTNFEAVNHDDLCASPRRIIPASKLVAQLTETPILSDVLSGLVQKREPVYVLWSYSEIEETTVGFFVYSDGAFRFIGMPHPVSVEELARNTDSTKGKIEAIQSSSIPPPADDLTNEVLAMQPVLVDPALVRRTAVLHVVINEAGKAIEVSYVRGPETFKDAAIQSLKQRQFERPSFAGRAVKLATCVNMVAPQ